MTLRFDTIAVTGGFHSDEQTGATNTPIYLSNAYQFKSADSAANLFDLKESGYIYTRLTNPTTAVLEERIALLEEGSGCVATSSGHFAELLIFGTLCKAGDEIVASTRLYGGTLNLTGNSLKRFGIKTIFADHTDPTAWENAVTDNTKAFFIESLANPDSSIPDFEGISKIAKKYAIPLIVDNTMATPYLFKPKHYGANIVVHSTTKYLSGHGGVMGGAAVDLGNFDWKKSGRFEEFCTPDASYHGLVFTEAFGNAALAVRMRASLLRDFGGNPSPFNSSLILQGIQTLHLRMPRHVSNAREIANFLSTHPEVESVGYPELKSHPSHKFAEKYLTKGAGALLTFKIKGGYNKAKIFIENLELCLHAANVGDARTIVTHPASTTHRQCSAEELEKTGITDNLIRISIGIEDPADIKEDITKALSSK